jgi:sulfur carrier protein
LRARIVLDLPHFAAFLDTPDIVITLRINGESRPLPAPLTIADLLAALELAGKRVAVEKNGEIVPKSQHTQVMADDGDSLEIVVAVGGG